MKLNAKFTKIPLLSLLFLVIVSAVTYFVINTYGFNFNSSLVHTTRAEIKGKPEDINKIVSEIYSKVDIIDVEVGHDTESNQIQRLYYMNEGEATKSIKDTVATNQNLTLSISDVTPGIKTDFSQELLNLLIVSCVFLLIINTTLFRKILDYQYTFLYTLLNIFTILVAVCILLTGFSVMGEYGWHISNYTLNVFVAFVFSLTAVLACISLLFKRSLGDNEYIHNVGSHFNNLVSGSLRTYTVTILILLLTFAPFFYFYYFRVEALVFLLMSIFISLFIRFAYVPVLNWYDKVRSAKNKFSKKKK